MTIAPNFDKANAQQLEAIKTTEGPLLIIAGPGSGKTYTLVERIVFLITEKQVLPEQLMVVTFTDKAAQELTTRISNRLNELEIRFNLNEMYLGTFHSICLRWLQEYREYTRLKRNFIMMDQFDQQYFIYQRINDYAAIPGIKYVFGEKENRLSSWKRTENAMNWVNMLNEEVLDVQKLISSAEEDIRALGLCAQLYRAQIEEENAIDFSTIQYETLKLFREHPQVVDELHAKLRYVMVDEYQDTNTVQEQILLTITGTENPNLCVVGDDDQGLYRFRGATIRNILQFKENFQADECKQVSLKTNYRSHSDIIQFYNRWMKEQDWEHQEQLFRYTKEILPRSEIFTSVPAVLKVGAKSADGWHQEVLEFLQALRNQGNLTDWNQVAFLFRSVKNENVKELASFLEQQGIPVYSPRANQFFDREEVKLMLGALIFLFPQFERIRKWNDDAHLDIWEYYDHKCFKTFAEALRKPENVDLRRWAGEKALLHYNLTQNTNYSFSGLFYELLRFPLFSRYLDEELLKSGLMTSRSMHNLGLFSQMINKFEYLHHISVLTPEFLEKNLRNLFNNFFRFLHDGGINEYEDEAEYAPSGHVSFLTIHQSKGLEFPIVVVGSLNSSPRKSYTALGEKLENNYYSRVPFEPLTQIKYYDFRRLYYTAFSRAQNLLVLTALEVDSGRGRNPSEHMVNYYRNLPSWRDPAIRLADIPLETIKDVNLKHDYSFTSHIAVYENCAEQYRFFNELAFAPVRKSPILFGTLVHQTIEDIHKTVLRGAEQKLSKEQIETWFDTNYAYLTRRERVYLAPTVRRLALDQVLRYYQRHEHDWSYVREAEVDISLVKDAYILSGKVDLIAGVADTVELVDFKSEKKLDVNDPKDQEKLNRYKRQLEVYAHIVEQRLNLVVSKTHLYYTSEESGNPYITFSKNEEAIGKTIATFDNVVQRIEAKDFSIIERPTKLCKDCDMRHYCDAKNWKFRSK